MRDVDRALVAVGALVVAGGDGAVVFEPVDAADPDGAAEDVGLAATIAAGARAAIAGT